MKRLVPLALILGALLAVEARPPTATAKDGLIVFVQDTRGGSTVQVADGRGESLLGLLRTLGTSDASLEPSAAAHLSARPAVLLLFALPTYSPCAPDFEPRTECAHESFVFYPPDGAEPAVLTHVGTSAATYRSDGLALGQARHVPIVDPEPRVASDVAVLTLDGMLAEAGVAPRPAERAGLATEGQVIVVGVAALLGLILVTGARVALRR